MSGSRFQIQFAPSEIPRLAALYDSKGDEKALASGHGIAQGDYSRANLEDIFSWKTKRRGISRLSSNSDSEIADALHLAVEAKTDRAAVAVLVGLSGVDVPVASAILTAINPERYTVIDFRALEALNVRIAGCTINFYLCYLAFCRGLAVQHHVSLRNLDRALWQWSKRQKEGSK